METKNRYMELHGKELLSDALKDMKAKNIKYGIVFSRNKIPKGIISMDDFAKFLYEDKTLYEGIVEDFMKRNFTVINEKTKLEELLEKNIETITFPMVIINRDGRFKGLLTEHDMLGLLYENLWYIKRILDNIDEGIIAIDSNDNITYINESWKQIHGIENNELIGENVKAKFPETKLGKNEGHAQGMEPLHLNFSGATVMPSYREIVDDENQPMGAMAIVKDYSKINNIYIGINRINNTNVLFNSMFNYLSEAVVYVDKKYQIAYCNKSFSHLFTAVPGDVLPDSKLKRIIKDKYKSVKIDVFNKEIELEVGSESRIFKIAGIPTVDADEQLDGIVIILHDITHLKELDHELQKHSKLLDYYKKEANRIPSEMICESTNFKEVVSTALKVASTDAAVLIEGENGVGKELVAKMIHDNSNRAGKAFIPVNCGAIPESLWESEMFGYEDGAFTGTKRGGKIGVFEMADGGTVFLDEIGEMSLSTQVKMLRFLQNMEIAKVGREEVKRVDVRILAATNKDMDKLVEEESFRIDLYYRLNVVKLQIPPLRKRIAEIRPLAEKFVSGFNDRYNKHVKISNEAIKLLERERWPGNIRQLRNIIEQSVIMCDEVIQPYDLSIDTNNRDPAAENVKIAVSEEDKWSIPLNVSNLEKELIVEALKSSGNNRSDAIKKLKISRKTFYKKLREYGLE